MPITQITLVSRDAGGNVGNSSSCESSRGSAFSAYGSYVAFSSDASNLVSGDTNGSRDVFATLSGFATNAAPMTDLNDAGAGNDNTASFTEQTPVLIAPAATVTD